MYFFISCMYLSASDVFFSIMCVSVCVFCICMYLYLWVSICMYLVVSCMYLHVLHNYFAYMPLKHPPDSAGEDQGQIPAHQSVLMPSLSQYCVSELPQRPGSVRHCPSKTPPGRDWRVPVSVCICTYQNVCGCIMYVSISWCMCTYLSVSA
jgi:hypothetical protein